MLNRVQNSLNFQLHRWSRFRWFSFIFNSQTKRSRRDQRCLFPYSINPPRRCELKRATGRAVELLAPARLRSNNSTFISNTSQVPYAFYPRIALQTPFFHLTVFSWKSLEPTPIGHRSSAVAVNVTNTARLSFCLGSSRRT